MIMPMHHVHTGPIPTPTRHAGPALSAKFASEGTFQMAFGSLSMFFGGLEALVNDLDAQTTPPSLSPSRAPSHSQLTPN